MKVLFISFPLISFNSLFALTDFDLSTNCITKFSSLQEVLIKNSIYIC